MKPGNVGDGVVHGPFLSARVLIPTVLRKEVKAIAYCLATPAFGKEPFGE
jgi:hypothetical protein